jgi:hypothetical protein
MHLLLKSKQGWNSRKQMKVIFLNILLCLCFVVFPVSLFFNYILTVFLITFDTVNFFLIPQRFNWVLSLYCFSLFLLLFYLNWWESTHLPPPFSAQHFLLPATSQPDISDDTCHEFKCFLKSIIISENEIKNIIPWILTSILC